MVAWHSDGQTRGSLVDILDRVLDKGLVVAGDIRVEVANVELLCIKVRLLVCSIDKAQEVGLDWWKQDPFFSSSAANEIAGLRERIQELEQRLALPEKPDANPDPPPRPTRRSGRQGKTDE